MLPPTVCEDMSKNWKSLRYDVYQYFMTERNLEETEFFNSIEKMISADSVQKYGKKVSIYHMHLNHIHFNHRHFDNRPFDHRHLKTVLNIAHEKEVFLKSIWRGIVKLQL